VELSGRFVESLTDAPLPYLQKLRLGLVLLSAVVMLMMCAVIGSLFFGAGLVILAAVLSGPVWFAGAWQVTTRRPSDACFVADAILDSDRLRWGIRASQAFCVVASVLFFLALMIDLTRGTQPVALATRLSSAGALTLVISALMLTPFGIYLSALSDWAGHGPVSVQFRLSAIIIALFGIIGLPCAAVVVLNPAGAGLTAFIALWAGLLAAIETVHFLVLVLRLTHSGHWAVQNARSAMERDARMEERSKRRSDELAARLNRRPSAPKFHREVWERDEPVPLAEPEPQATDTTS